MIVCGWWSGLNVQQPLPAESWQNARCRNKPKVSSEQKRGIDNMLSWRLLYTHPIHARPNVRDVMPALKSRSPLRLIESRDVCKGVMDLCRPEKKSARQSLEHCPSVRRPARIGGASPCRSVGIYCGWVVHHCAGVCC